MGISPPVGFAFIGLGWWGGVLAEAATASGVARVTGGYARTPSSREAFAARHGGRNFSSLEEVLSDPETEAVVIATANAVHKEIAVAAARAGKHVHLEKPMALSVSDARAIVAACGEAGVKLHIGQNFRRWPMFRRAKALLEEGALGLASFAVSQFSYNLGLTAGAGSMRWDPAENPGGPLYSYTIHTADLMEHLFGEVVAVGGMCDKVGGPSGTDDAAAALLRFRTGMIGVVSGSYLSPFRFTFDIQGTKANLGLSSDRPPRLQPAEGLMEDAAAIDVGCGFIEGRDIANREQFLGLARCIRLGGEPEVTGIHGVRALAIMRALLRSNAEGREVPLREVLEGD